MPRAPAGEDGPDGATTRKYEGRNIAGKKMGSHFSARNISAFCPARGGVSVCLRGRDVADPTKRHGATIAQPGGAANPAQRHSFALVQRANAAGSLALSFGEGVIIDAHKSKNRRRLDCDRRYGWGGVWIRMPIPKK